MDKEYFDMMFDHLEKSFDQRMTSIDEKLAIRMRAIDEKLKARIEAIDEKLTIIHSSSQLNGTRLTGVELDIVDLRKDTEVREQTCPQKPRLDKIEKDLIGVNWVMSNPFKIAVFLFFAAIGVLYYYFNVPIAREVKAAQVRTVELEDKVDSLLLVIKKQ